MMLRPDLLAYLHHVRQCQQAGKDVLHTEEHKDLRFKRGARANLDGNTEDLVL